MTTKRTRTSRHMQLSQEALDWLRTDDARQFFTDPDYESLSYGDPIHKLPGVRPWWNSLHEAWQRHCDGLPLEGDPRTQQPALDFVLALHAEFEAHQSQRKSTRSKSHD